MEQDIEPARGARSRKTGAYVLAATVLASAMAFIDGTVVTIALPVIQSDFSANFQELQWVVNGYTLMLGALILVGGALGDRVGRRRVFAVGIVIFGIASLLCALAWDVGVLIAARIVQGVGAALLVPQSLAIIAASFPRETRGRAIGVWAAASAITTALGPPIGGFAIDLFSWRFAFLINLPLSAAALLLTFTHVPESRDDSATGAIDWTGSAIAVISFAVLTYGLTLLSNGSASTGAIAPLALATGIGGLLVFWRFERRIKNPILPTEIFHSRPFLVTNIATLFLYGALAAVLFLLPFDLIARRGMSASSVGLTLLPFGLIIGVLSRFSGGLADRFGARTLLVVGSLMVAAASVLLGLVIADYWLGVFLPIVVMALGMAAVVTPLTTVVMNSAPDQQSGTASGINNAASRIAGLVAVAALGALASVVFHRQGAPSGARFGELPAVGAETRSVLEAAFVSAYSTAMLAAGLLSVLAAGAVFFGIGRQDGRSEQASVRRFPPR